MYASFLEMDFKDKINPESLGDKLEINLTPRQSLEAPTQRKFLGLKSNIDFVIGETAPLPLRPTALWALRLFLSTGKPVCGKAGGEPGCAFTDATADGGRRVSFAIP